MKDYGQFIFRWQATLQSSNSRDNFRSILPTGTFCRLEKQPRTILNFVGHAAIIAQTDAVRAGAAMAPRERTGSG